MSKHISPFAPGEIGDVPPIGGIELASMAAGIKYEGREDLLLMTFATGTTVAGVFTQSKCPSAAVETCRKHLPHGEARALVVNSGNANAFTGMKGKAAADETVSAAIAAIGCAPHEVFISSTGVIGEPMDTSEFGSHLITLSEKTVADGWAAAASAIMTTDTFPKVVSRTFQAQDKTITVNGIAKGAGMIAPDMATMLAYIATDASVSATALQTILSDSVGDTFNAVSVDSDTSTSDTLLAFATGAAGNTEITAKSSEGFTALASAIRDVMSELALLIVSDGEGITKRFRVDINGAASDASAKRIARAIVDSPLVKTAIAGEDPNWGRIVMAVGKAGEPADRDRLEIHIGDMLVASNGERAATYIEADCARYMKNAEIHIAVDLGLGMGKAFMWGCDLTAEYVSINADYRS
ncbi:MAG: bifunctional glutamate N-acetyltransferase/amino-acid acetyltransferase ArgJ [Pseudomonadota bacterium]